MDEHYFSETSTTDAARHALRVRLAGTERELVSARGVFSGGGLDKATAVLLDRLDMLPEPRPGARIVDVGCGWGPIALTAALLHPDAEVWAVDVSERARALTAENARRLGLETVRVCAPEEIPADLVADVIWSNPPIRIGKEALHALLLEWADRLAPEGWMALVVGRNLGADPLASWLDDQLPRRAVRKAASAKGFRILEISPER
ncbi:class I SAM-dependent methyltransferase [Brachybacterium hainanense]|uniref:Class I SAM-dependent methyltransferase n=1 Tax=Brachybacterium hainanense TaxID=1541174 RepID=A0ABV6REV6_9MICO